MTIVWVGSGKSRRSSRMAHGGRGPPQRSTCRRSTKISFANDAPMRTFANGESSHWEGQLCEEGEGFLIFASTATSAHGRVDQFAKPSANGRSLRAADSRSVEFERP